MSQTTSTKIMRLRQDMSDLHKFVIRLQDIAAASDRHIIDRQADHIEKLTVLVAELHNEIHTDNPVKLPKAPNANDPPSAG